MYKMTEKINSLPFASLEVKDEPLIFAFNNYGFDCNNFGWKLWQLQRKTTCAFVQLKVYSACLIYDMTYDLIHLIDLFCHR